MDPCDQTDGVCKVVLPTYTVAGNLKSCFRTGFSVRIDGAYLLKLVWHDCWQDIKRKDEKISKDFKRLAVTFSNWSKVESTVLK